MSKELVDRSAPRTMAAVRPQHRRRRAVGVTERLAVASARRPRRLLAIWGLAVVVAVVLVVTSLHGLTTNAHVVGTTESSQAEALYDHYFGGAGDQKPTDVIVVSSKRATVISPNFQRLVFRLVAEVRIDPGIGHVKTDLAAKSPFVASNRRAVLIALQADSNNAIKPVVADVEAANGSKGFSVAVTGNNTVGNDFTTLATSDLQHGELDFGLPIAIVILLLVFGSVVVGLTPVLMALISIVVGFGIAAIVSQVFSLSVFIIDMMTGMGLALGIDYSLFVISRFARSARVAATCTTRSEGREPLPAVQSSSVEAPSSSRCSACSSCP